MRVGACLCAVLALAGCGKKKSPQEQESPPPPADWKAVVADLDEGDFDALCDARMSAVEDKATDAVAELDALGEKWKATSRDEMHQRAKAAGTNVVVVGILDDIYTHAVCGDRSLVVGAKLTLDKIPFAESKDLEPTIDAAAKTTVFSAKGFSTLFSDIAGPWVKVAGGESGPISLASSIGAEGQFDFEGAAVPQLVAKSSVSINGQRIAIDPISAQGGSIKYTKRTNTQTGMSNTDDALYRAAEHMVADISAQTAAAISKQLGLVVPPDPAIDALDGSWDLAEGATETNTCPTQPDSSKFDTFTTFVDVDARARTLDGKPAKVADGKMTTTKRQDGACESHRDKLVVTFVAGKKTMAWTIYDAACKPCAFTVEQPVTKHH